MNIQQLLKDLKLPERSSDGFEKNFDRSMASFQGMPEHMTMDFVRRYYEWVKADPAHLGLFERVSDLVAGNEALQRYAHHVHNALYVYPMEDCKYGAWPQLSALLGEKLCGIFDFMTAMSAIPLWCETHRRLGIPEKYSRASARWLNGTLQIYNSAHPGCYGIDRTQSYWLRWNIDARLFRIGRFEYMDDGLEDWLPAVFRSRTTGRTVALCGDNWGLLPDGSRAFAVADEADAPLHTKLEITESQAVGTYISPAGFAVPGDVRTLDLTEYEPVFHPGDLILGMHIPGGGNMTLELAYESWREALEFFPKYLKKEVRGICCRSWILNPSFERELPESNLAKLMREVYLFPERSFGRDGAFFAFGRTDGDFSDYQRDNSLRRAFHRIVEAGELLKTGGMFILPPEILNHDCERYRIEG